MCVRGPGLRRNSISVINLHYTGSAGPGGRTRVAADSKYHTSAKVRKHDERGDHGPPLTKLRALQNKDTRHQNDQVRSGSFACFCIGNSSTCGR